MDLLMETRRPIMLVGNAGCGKTVLAGEKFSSLDPDQKIVANVPFNYYTTSAMLQQVLEKPLEKKAGRNYGPPGAKKLVYFIDDMNMPEVRHSLNLIPVLPDRFQLRSLKKKETSFLSVRKEQKQKINYLIVSFYPVAMFALQGQMKLYV